MDWDKPRTSATHTRALARTHTRTHTKSTDAVNHRASVVRNNNEVDTVVGQCAVDYNTVVYQTHFFRHSSAGVGGRSGKKAYVGSRAWASLGPRHAAGSKFVAGSRACGAGTGT